jgi:hypothetical protein
MTLEFHPYVLEDVRVAALGYEETSPVMVDAFLGEVSARLGKVLENPEEFPLCAPNTSFRRAKLWRFPQSIVYRVENGVVYVSLIAHAITSGEEGGGEKTQRLGVRLGTQHEKRLAPASVEIPASS